MSEGNSKLEQIITYMKAHWPSQVKPEWQVGINDYSRILPIVLKDLTKDKTRSRNLVRIAGLSGSGKTTQLLPATEAYFDSKNLSPVLVAARVFVDYHPYHQEIKEFYGEENLRKMTDEFSTIMLFLAITEIIKNGYDIILDVTLLDPTMEEILQGMLKAAKYNQILLMIAISPVITEKFLSSRAWRHTKETEAEFIRATKKSLDYYVEKHPDTHIIIWSVYDKPPVFDGKIKDCLETYEKYSVLETLPQKDDDERREAKIDYLKNYD
ncbi:zeta toxin family protein [Candidatus Saccharibacteria bacterium]|nr:zeta toxin family protein [Candidatus Saccharibacteria bacterium]